MSRTNTASAEPQHLFDHCLLGACIKKVFSGTNKLTKGSHFIIRNKIDEVAHDLEILNRDGITEMSSLYFSALEHSLPGVRMRYTVVYRGDTPVLFGFFQVFMLTSNNFKLGETRSFSKTALRFVLHLKNFKVMMSGNALKNDCRCYTYDKRALNAEEAAELFIAAAEKVAADECVSAVILKDLPENASHGEILSDNGYKVPMDDQVMVMDIAPEWKTFADYVAALSRKYKTRANKIIAARTNLETRVLTQGELAKYQADLYRLYNNVVDNQPFVLARVSASHFARMKKVYGEAFDIVGFFDGDRLLAFYTGFHTDYSYEIYYVGLDYERNSEHQLYFNILFSGLERAIELGRKQLKLGRTSFDAKASLGARPVANHYMLKTGHLPDVVSRWFVNYFTAMEDGKWKVRNPLATKQ